MIYTKTSVAMMLGLLGSVACQNESIFHSPGAQTLRQAPATVASEADAMGKAAPSSGEASATEQQSAENSAPVLSDVSLTSYKNAAISIQLTASDRDGDAITYTIAELSESIAAAEIQNTTGVLLLKPRQDFIGALNLTVTASDGIALSEPAQVSISVLDSAPEAVSLVVSTVKDSPVAITLAAHDPIKESALAFEISASPAHGMIEGFDSAQGTLEFVPAENFVGETQFSFRASTSLGSGEGSVRVDVRNEAPVTMARTIAIDRLTASPVVIDLAALSSDADGHPLTYKLVQPPKSRKYTFDANAGKLSYLPDLTAGLSDSFLFEAFDGAARSLPSAITLNMENALPLIKSKPSLDYEYYRSAGDSVIVNATVRDFRADHPDFENVIPGLERGLVADTLDADGKPVFVGRTQTIESQASFAQWYRDVPGVNIAIPLPLELKKTTVGSGSVYSYYNSSFFPINNQGYGNEGLPSNFHFTLELATTFKYTGGEVFSFTGDDDIWVFINNRLVLDIGGVHGEVSDSLALDSLGLTKGKEYQFKLFFAERHTWHSNFKMQTSMVLKSNIVYKYQVAAVDPEGSKLKYALVSAPAGMTIDATSGLIEWLPQANQMGKSPVTVMVTDADGGMVKQSFEVNVK